MSAGDINIKIQDVIEWLTEQKGKSDEMPIITISTWLLDRLNEQSPKSKPKVSPDQPVEEKLYKKFFPKDGDDVKLFERVVDAINVHHPPEDIELLNPKKRYNSDNVKKTFPNVIDIFVTHFKTLKPKPDEFEIKKFALLFKERVKPTTEIKTMTRKDTVDCIGTFITNEIANDPVTLQRIITEQSKDPQTFVGTGTSGSNGSGAGGGRRSRRNSSSTRRRPRRGKSSATKPRRRTARK